MAGPLLSAWVVSLIAMSPLARTQSDSAASDQMLQEDQQANDQSYDEEAQQANRIADHAAQEVGPQIPSQQLQLLQQSSHGEAPMAKAAATSSHAATQSPKESVQVAEKAALEAGKVAAHSVKIIGKSKTKLKNALGALHDARVDSAGMSRKQTESLKKAEAHLREATKTANFGKLQKLQRHLDSIAARSKNVGEREQMRREIQELRDELKRKNINDKDIDKALADLEADLANSKGPVNDESKAELERLRQLIDSLDAVDSKSDAQSNDVVSVDAGEAATPVQEKGLDIDTQMPYGELEPFGREDTAQELTEASISESDAMVDQLERAEVAEEKRAVFRALTRLRGAAITSFDGVARSQTGQIDEYNKIHKWRNTHPLHHLADEESDVSKWAFPDNAD